MNEKTPIRIAAIAFNKIEGIRAIMGIAGIELKVAKEIVERLASDSDIIGVRGISGDHALILTLDQVIKGCDID